MSTGVEGAVAGPVSIRRWRHRLFRLGVVLKGVDGLLEVAGGVLLAALGRQGVSRTVAFLTQRELAEDPRDVVAGFLVHHVGQMAVGTLRFAVIYLLAHGAVKIWLAGGLLRERRWVFPIALAFLGAFIVYQIYRLTYLPSAALAALTVLDVVILLLVWREYMALRQAG